VDKRAERAERRAANAVAELVDRGFLPYMRASGAAVMARLNSLKPYQPCPGVTCRTGEYEVREGELGNGWIHTVSPEVFRDYYV
jgi:hypothetical protein